MDSLAHIALVVDRLKAHAAVIEHTLPVFSEAEEYDLEATLEQELAKGGLHLVVAAGDATFGGDAPTARAGVKGTREIVVTLAYLPGLRPPPVPPLVLAESLCRWLHGHPETGAWLRVTREGPVPEGAAIAGRQISLRADSVLRRELSPGGSD